MLKSTKNAASSGFNVYFDYVEAAVEADVPAAPQGYTDRSVATDYDTDHSYKLPPARLVWQIDKSGIRGDVNHYVGVFWWNQRKRVGGVWKTWTVTFGGTWASGDAAFLTIGGTTMGKSVFPADTLDTIASHFVYFINETFVGVWAERTVNTGELKVHVRTPVWEFTKSTSKSSASGTITESGDLSLGTEGTWEIDAAATPVINKAATDWHADYFAEVDAKGWTATVAFSMELVDPPDAPSADVWVARFNDGTPVETATGFGTLKSSHCSFVSKVADYQQVAYKEMADLMSAAGLTVWLQFGEFVWWFFAGGSPASMAYYDDDTKVAAQTALGRALVVFDDPNDDPGVNSYEDANFLRGRVKSHIDTIRNHVLASHSGAKFELLWPRDVNEDSEQLNRYVNLPSEYEQKSGSGLDRLKMEALAFGSVERDMDKAREAVRFPYTSPLSWDQADVMYLVPWFNGGCPWREEYLIAGREQLGGVAFWAWDHLGLFGWDLPLPEEATRSAFVGV